MTLFAVASTAVAQFGSGESLPIDIANLLEVNPLPRIAMDPQRRFLLLVHEEKLVSIERLKAPAIDLAGRRINPATTAPHAPLNYFGLTLLDLVTGEESPIPLPDNAIIGFPEWAPDGSRFAFKLARATGRAELWIGEPTEMRARPLVTAVNASRGSPCHWTPDSRRLLCRRVTAALGGGSQAASWEAWLDDLVPQAFPGQPTIVSEPLARHLLESQLELIDSISGQRHLVGSPAAFESVEPAPAGALLLVTRILEPYPQVSGIDATHRTIEIWDRFGNVVKRLPTDIRAVAWHGAKPATLTWVERRNGVDRVMLLPPPYTAEPTQGFALPHRFGGLRWIGDSGAALVSDYDPILQQTDLWHIDFDVANSSRRVTGFASARPQTPLMRPNRFGIPAIISHEGGIYLRGEEQRRPVLDYVHLRTGAESRVWEGQGSGYESLVDILTMDARVTVTRRESLTTPPNYYVAVRDSKEDRALTRLQHPAPPLVDASRIRLEYTRDDGLELASTLYLPPGTDSNELPPLIVWAYPRQVLAGANAKAPEVHERFLSFARAFRLFFLLRGYAVLDEVSMPIVGDGDANDTFIDQIVANAAAAIDAARVTGQVDTTRVGIAGHSYGAFMVANLLAHSRIFGAGIALSGAYNRTLTPFGFQTERRTFWEAPEAYLAMSPFLYANQIEAPLLLVHGLLDDNAGTAPIQSTQFYEAIRGNGGEVDLLLLPSEGHQYRARESVFETANQMLEWFDRYLRDAQFSPQKETGAFLRP